MDTSLTVAEHAAAWIELQRTRLQPSTWHEYEGALRRYVVPHLGATAVVAVTHQQVTALYHRLLTAGGLRGKPLALVTGRRIGAILHKFFADAERTGLIDRNPCDLAVLPRIDLREGPKELRVWTAEQLSGFLERERHRPLWPLWVVAAGTGMRRGEVLGLRWKDVDRAGGTLHIRRALSSVAGATRLKVPKVNGARSIFVGEAVLAALDHRAREQAAFTDDHVGLVDPPESASWDLVFTEPDGGYMNPQKVTDTWREAVRDAPQPVIRFHDVRHTHATLLLQAGVSPKVVSARLGHSNIKTTLDIYSEVLPAMDQDAADAFEDHVWGAPTIGGDDADVS